MWVKKPRSTTPSKEFCYVWNESLNVTANVSSSVTNINP